jgi:hypothetical protein
MALAARSFSPNSVIKMSFLSEAKIPLSTVTKEGRNNVLFCDAAGLQWPRNFSIFASSVSAMSKYF